MTRFKTVPHQLYDGADGGIIHFDEESLHLTELTTIHTAVLEQFAIVRTKEDVVQIHAGNEEIVEVIDELIELGLIAEQPSLPYLQIIDLQPKVRAFRIVLTEQCNLRCAECFVTKNQDSLRTMSEETLERVIRQSVQYGSSDRIVYHFFGGEPLIRFDYIKRAVEILEEAVLSGRMVRPLYTITTNLTLLDDEILSFFLEHDFKVGVSIDGPEELNDRLRIYVGGRGTFQDVARNYKRLIAKGIDSHVLITPHPDHLEELPVIFQTILEQFPMKTITVNTPLHFHTVQWTVPGEAYARLLIQLLRIAKEFNVSVDSAASPPLAALAGNIRREGPCALICDRIMASVGPDGSMSFCSQKWHPYLSAPSVEAGAEMRTPIRRADECVTCEARHICGGPCPAYQRISGGILDDNKCDFMRTLLREAAMNLDLFEVLVES